MLIYEGTDLLLHMPIAGSSSLAVVLSKINKSSKSLLTIGDIQSEKKKNIELLAAIEALRSVIVGSDE